MKKRILSTIFLWSFLFIVLFFGDAIGCFCTLLAASTLTQYEFYQLLSKIGHEPMISWGIALGLLLPLLCASTCLNPGEALTIVLASSCALASLKHSISLMQRSLLPTLCGIIYIPFMLSFVVKFMQDAPQATATTLLLIAISKFSDVGGLLVGCRFGKHKLAPSFSPNKTIEGMLGGVLGSIIVGVGGFLMFKNYLIPGLTFTNVTALSAVLSIIALLGDIVESAIKRMAAVKDSGNLIPGIGGVFDLTDSLIFSLPIGIILIEHIAR